MPQHHHTGRVMKLTLASVPFICSAFPANSPRDWQVQSTIVSIPAYGLADGEAGSSGIGSNVEQTRALVASLQTAVHFIEALSESLAIVTQLLASSTMTDVQESITLLIYCHKFQVRQNILTV